MVVVYSYLSHYQRVWPSPVFQIVHWGLRPLRYTKTVDGLMEPSSGHLFRHPRPLVRWNRIFPWKLRQDSWCNLKNCPGLSQEIKEITYVYFNLWFASLGEQRGHVRKHGFSHRSNMVTGAVRPRFARNLQDRARSATWLKAPPPMDVTPWRAVWPGGRIPLKRPMVKYSPFKWFMMICIMEYDGIWPSYMGWTNKGIRRWNKQIPLRP